MTLCRGNGRDPNRTRRSARCVTVKWLRSARADARHALPLDSCSGTASDRWAPTRRSRELAPHARRGAESASGFLKVASALSLSSELKRRAKFAMSPGPSTAPDLRGRPAAAAPSPWPRPLGRSFERSSVPLPSPAPPALGGWPSGPPMLPPPLESDRRSRPAALRTPKTNPTHKKGWLMN